MYSETVINFLEVGSSSVALFMEYTPMEVLPECTDSSMNQQEQQWVISMRNSLVKAEKYAADEPWTKWCIYRVPRRIKVVQGDIRAYEPQTVSIGPYHHGSKHLQAMDRYKWIALHRILGRTGQDLTVFLSSIKEEEEEARACYKEELSHLSSDQFVELLVLDACFILELLRPSPEPKDPIFSNKRLIKDILLDMVMLENQIPLFILDKLLVTISTSNNPDELLRHKAVVLTLTKFGPELLTGKALPPADFDMLKESLQQRDCLHILDVFRRSLLRVGPRRDNCLEKCLKKLPTFLKKWLPSKPKVSGHGQVIHCVTDLRETGVTIIRNRNTIHFWDIRFEKGFLQIPRIWIRDCTMSILFNVAAFEHCHLKIGEAVIGSYVVLMDCLLKSAQDVGYLHRHRIIQHILGNDAAVIEMFKNLSKAMQVDADSGYYTGLSKEVNAYCSKRKYKWQANLMKTYFHNPWAIISFVVAVLLLFMTGLQTYYAIIAYYKPPGPN